MRTLGKKGTASLADQCADLGQEIVETEATLTEWTQRLERSVTVEDHANARRETDFYATRLKSLRRELREKRIERATQALNTAYDAPRREESRLSTEHRRAVDHLTQHERIIAQHNKTLQALQAVATPAITPDTSLETLWC